MLIAVSSLIIIYLLLSFTINSLILPRKIKPLIIEAIQTSTGKKAAIDSISFSLLRGISIDNLTISNAIDSLPLKFSQIRLGVKYVGLIFQKELVYNFKTAPIEKLNIYIESRGIYRLRDKSLTTKIYVYEFPLVLVRNFIKRFPVEILEGKTDLEAELVIDRDRNISVNALLPIKNISLKAFKQTLSGNLDIAVQISKTAQSQLVDYRGKINPEGLELSLSGTKQTVLFSGGEIDFDSDTVEIKDLRFSYLEIPYNLAGKITHLMQPEIKLNLTGQKLSADVELSYAARNLDIKKALIKLPASNIEIQGSVKDLKTSDVDIYLVGDLNTADLEMLPFKFLSRIKEISPDSLLHTECHLAGSLKEWTKMNSLLKLKSNRLKVNKYTLDNLNATLKMEKENLNASIESDLYEGKLKIDIAQFSFKEGLPFNAKLSIEDLNLKKLNEDSLKLNQEIAGNLAAELSAQGNLKALKEISGEGWLEVTEGKLWELPLFKGLAGIIEIPGVEKNVFKEAHGNFIIKNQALTTKDLQLISKRITLNTAGSIYFNGNLDLHIKTEFPKDSAEATIGLDKLQDVLLKGASSLVKEIQVTGSLKKPEYKVVPVAMENIFQNILQ